jgi:hypothetical protein
MHTEIDSLAFSTHTRMPAPTPPQGRQFRVVLTEGRPDETGLIMARVLDDLKIPVSVVLDSGVAYVMERWGPHVCLQELIARRWGNSCILRIDG